MISGVTAYPSSNFLEAGSPTSSKEAGESYAAAWKGGEL
jgi:hypothetical protein